MYALNIGNPANPFVIKTSTVERVGLESITHPPGAVTRPAHRKDQLTQSRKKGKHPGCLPELKSNAAQRISQLAFEIRRFL